MRRLRPLLLPALSGVLYFLSWIGFGIWPLAFICFLPLLWSLREATKKQALFRGFFMGFVTHLGGYTWVIHLLTVFAFLPYPLAFLGYLLICAGQGLLFGVFGLILRWAWTRSSWPMAALLPLALVATEFIFPLLFQSYTGVALMPLVPLVQIADLGGALLLSALQGGLNGALYDALAARTSGKPLPRLPLAAAFAALLLSGAYGLWRIRSTEQLEKSAPALRIGIAQPNVGELELHQNPQASVEALWSQTAQLRARGAAVVVWPEGGYNAGWVRPGTDGRTIQGGLPEPVIAGVGRVGSPADFFNSAVAIDAQGRIGEHFDKIALLAFGEYIPGGDWFPQIYKWSPMSSHLTRGTTTAPLHLLGYRFATFICYEDILPALVRSIMEDHGDGRAHVLVNLTNDSWYGTGHEQEQHLMLAAVRSIEHRRWLVRATSTGISAFVDAEGRVVTRIARDTGGIADRDVPMLQGSTVYQWAGDWPGWLSWGALGLLAVRRATRRTSASR